MGLTTRIVAEDGREVTDKVELLTEVALAWDKAVEALDYAWKITPPELHCRTPVSRGASDHRIAYDAASAQRVQAQRVLGAVVRGREQRERGASYAPESDEAAIEAATRAR